MRRALFGCWVSGIVLLSLACSKRERAGGVEPSPAPVEATAAAPALEKPPSYVGIGTCASCHEAEHARWEGSHHDLAMQQATPETVLGDFDGAEVRYYGETVRFTRDAARFSIDALGPDGARRRFYVRYAFGVDPMQQYLVETEPGRLQAFPVAWDTRPKSEGGQRWFHLQPDEYIEPGDPLHWTGPSFNWNHACADCHSTAVKKNYDRATKRFSTQYFEIDVGCEACHGPGSRHVERAESGEQARAEGPGFDRRLPSNADRAWSFVDGHPIAVLKDAPPNDQLQTCAPCHARRSDLGGDAGGFHDRYRLAALDSYLYFDDGQIRDEVYVYGSFLQSKMHAAGVVCGDCHDSHSNALHAEGNALCGRCHSAEVFDGPQHHFHPQDASGSLCTDCHMPKRAYMVHDLRGDHRFGLPRPALSAEVGAPDACTGCHRDRTAKWAERQIDKRFEQRSPHGFAEAFHAARLERPGGQAALLELVVAGKAPDIVRATALLELGDVESRATPALAMRAVHDRSPLVRRAAASSARELPLEQRVEIVRPLLRDPERSVRIEAVGALLGADARSWSAADRDALKKATSEYLASRSFNADRGEGLVDLAHVAALSGDLRHAEENLREAIDLDPTFTAAYVNLADLYRASQRDEEAESVLRAGLKKAADPAAVDFALGLTLVRLRRHEEALSHLERAARLRPEVVRFSYVCAVAQFDLGRRDASLRTLEAIRRRYPANRQALALLVDYNRQMGRTKAADRYAAELEELAAP